MLAHTDREAVNDCRVKRLHVCCRQLGLTEVVNQVTSSTSRWGCSPQYEHFFAIARGKGIEAHLVFVRVDVGDLAANFGNCSLDGEQLFFAGGQGFGLQV